MYFSLQMKLSDQYINKGKKKKPFILVLFYCNVALSIAFHAFTSPKV